MSQGYADYRVTRELMNQPVWAPEGGPGDYSRLILFGVIVLAFGIGLFFYTRANDPVALVRLSAEKTILSPFSASVEGATLLDGSETATYRSHESSVPGKPVDVTVLPGAVSAPFNSRETLELLRGVVKAKEMKRMDMYGHPARHISGELANPKALPGQPKTYHFDYWLDLMNRKAVRLVVTGKTPGAVVTVVGDSITSEIFLNVRWKY